MRLRRLHCTSSLLAVFLLLSCSLAQRTPASTQSPLPSPSQYPGWAEGHIIGLQSKRTLTSVLPKDAARDVYTVAQFLKFLDDDVNKNIEAQNKGKAEAGKVETRTCNVQNSEWTTAAASYLELRGVKRCDTECATQREFSTNFPPARVRNLRPALRSWASKLNATAAKIGATLVGTLGTNSLAGVGRFVYPDRDAQNCTLWHTMAVRVNNKWYLQARVTTKAVNPAGSSWDSHYLIEHVHADSPTTFGAPLRLHVPMSSNSAERIVTTTTNETWGRPSPDSTGQSPDVLQNLAFRAALNKGDNEFQQATDAVQASNIAILFLPLAMNLVPVALIADVNTLGMLMYTALTDVLTTVPLCIKGVELINIANDNFHAVSAQVAGKKGAAETAVAEIWAASCHLHRRPWLRRLGVIFVVVSMTLMTFGVSCEFIARAWVRKRRRLAADPLLAGEQTYGATSAYQPFTAAALTLQNRVPSAARAAPTGGIMPPPPQMHPPGPFPGSSSAHAARSPQLGLLAHGRPQAHPAYPAPGAAPQHVHGEHCRCACHSTAHGGRAHEYDARPYPDPLARKYH